MAQAAICPLCPTSQFLSLCSNLKENGASSSCSDAGSQAAPYALLIFLFCLQRRNPLIAPISPIQQQPPQATGTGEQRGQRGDDPMAAPSESMGRCALQGPGAVGSRPQFWAWLQGMGIAAAPLRDSITGQHSYSTRDAPEPPGCGKFGFPSLFLASSFLLKNPL